MKVSVQQSGSHIPGQGQVSHSVISCSIRRHMPINRNTLCVTICMSNNTKYYVASGLVMFISWKRQGHVVFPVIGDWITALDYHYVIYLTLLPLLITEFTENTVNMIIHWSIHTLCCDELSCWLNQDILFLAFIVFKIRLSPTDVFQQQKIRCKRQKFVFLKVKMNV